MGLTKQQVELVHLTGLVHDIGKIGVPAEVLQKTAALTDDEWALMREHSEIGARILGEVEDYAEVAEIVLLPPRAARRRGVSARADRRPDPAAGPRDRRCRRV